MNANEMYESLKAMLSDVVPDVELRYKAEIAVEINRLKVEKNAVILGHNYMEPVLYYSVTDIKGDSLELSRKAATTEKDIIVFCGVKFMAETAKILNPTKTVLLPAEAGCSLAASITAQDVRDLIAWADRRGTPITIRLVKGAYWDSDTVRHHQAGWPVPLFEQKAETDANYEALIPLLLRHRDVIRPAFGTHNLRSL